TDIRAEPPAPAPAGAEHQAHGRAEPAAADGDKVIQVGAGSPVEAGDPTLMGRKGVADIDVAVGSENGGAGLGQLTALDEFVEECAGSAVEAQDRLDLPGALGMAGAHVDVVGLGAEDHRPGLVQPAVAVWDELVHKRARGLVVAEHAVGLAAGDQQVAAAAGGGNTSIFELLDGQPSGRARPLAWQAEPG